MILHQCGHANAGGDRFTSAVKGRSDVVCFILICASAPTALSQPTLPKQPAVFM